MFCNFQSKSFVGLLFVYLILKYFIHFDASMKLTSFSNGSQTDYRNTTDICILILYPACLPNMFTRCNHFVVDSLGFVLGVRSCHLEVEVVLILPF